MIDKKLEEKILKERKHGEFIYPFYEKYCFSNIPSTIISSFGVKTKRQTLPPELYEEKIDGSDKVVLILIDGFGYYQWLKYYKNNKFLKIFSQRGLVSPLTTVFPSTTAAAITTINTDLTPQEHGLPEWNVYYKEIDMIIDTLPFRSLGDKEMDSLLKKKVNPKILFNKQTIYQKLKKNGIKSFNFKNRNYVNSEYSKLCRKGSESASFIISSDLAVNLRKNLEKEDGGYFFAYYDALDSIQHRYGPNTEQHEAEIFVFLYSLKRELEKLKMNICKKTTIIITADHGQINIDPKKTLYLNKYQKLVDSFQKSENGKKILPTGSPRDVYLYIKPNKLDEIENYLSKKLQGKAEIMRSENALKLDLFGIGRIQKDFRDRIGNLLILPHKGHSIWYEHIKGKRVKSMGHHGGLSREEMLVPFSVTKLSELVKQ